MKRALFLIIIVLWFQIENRDKKGGRDSLIRNLASVGDTDTFIASKD